MKTFKQFKRELFAKNPKVKEEYEKLRPEYEALGKIIELRIKHKMSQKQLAAKMGTKQPAISRFERQMENPTIAFLAKIASVFGKKLVIDFR